LKQWALHKNHAWVYSTYIAVACAVTSGLNIVHTKYILGIEPHALLFTVPIIAGVIFGYVTARQRIASHDVINSKESYIFAKYIIFSCAITAGLNVAHTEWILARRLSGDLFIAPMIAGVFFGYLLARIKTLNNHLVRMATTDSLTQITNRAQFDYCLDKAIQLTKRTQNTFSIIYFDVDNFKQVNDSHGHHIGDELLQRIAAEVKSNSRKSDIVARYGGDEFIVLLPNTDLQNAELHARHLCEEIARIQFNVDNKISCSFGVVQYYKGMDNILSVLQSADKALYNAKLAGKNCIALA
jgi:diguanylate cyclase (GGDEF)-like protein